MFVLDDEAKSRRTKFFQFVFADSKGLVCLSRKNTVTNAWEDQFFSWPGEAEAMEVFIERFYTDDLYYSPMLYDYRRRKKEHVTLCPCAWSDLDECDPDKLSILPSFEMESSPGHFQALWMFQNPVDPHVAEDISMRIAYKYKDEGADTTGWDLTQVLRIPYTNNFKYGGVGEAPLVKILKARDLQYVAEDFDVYPVVVGFEYTAIPFPTDPLPSSEDVLNKYRRELHTHVWFLFQHKPKDDWSKLLWQLEMLLFESGLSREETFVVARDAACNKYERDGRSAQLLWKEVCRAEFQMAQRNAIPLSTGSLTAPLLTDEERASVTTTETFIDRYIAWAKTTGDAAWQYHQVGGFVVLSSLLAGTVKLPTSFGPIIPNLWFMILADTTLTRKTTAMDLAVDLVSEVDSDIILATDGSIEGLFTSLSMRPGRPSVFLRDEFSGLLEAMTKKDYYAGMAETLTKLYDGRMQKRVLRKEVISVKDPILILFAGGIKSRVYNLLTQEFISSGFMPRFVVVMAESDVAGLKPLGPPSEKSLEGRNEILHEMSALKKKYSTVTSIVIDGTTTIEKRGTEARLSPDAWLRYNRFEADMLQSALNSNHREFLTPSFDRLAKSGLKAAILLAAARCVNDPTVIVEIEDILKAISFVEHWRTHTLGLVRGVGLTQVERTLQLILRAVEREPGVHRGTLMSRFHLTKRDADQIFETLDQRGQIVVQRAGKGSRMFPVKGVMDV